jgi:hypothetical protein
MTVRRHNLTIGQSLGNTAGKNWPNPLTFCRNFGAGVLRAAEIISHDITVELGGSDWDYPGCTNLSAPAAPWRRRSNCVLGWKNSHAGMI